jgi:hypothetical protein
MNRRPPPVVLRGFPGSGPLETSKFSPGTDKTAPSFLVYLSLCTGGSQRHKTRTAVPNEDRMAAGGALRRRPGMTSQPGEPRGRCCTSRGWVSLAESRLQRALFRLKAEVQPTGLPAGGIRFDGVTFDRENGGEATHGGNMRHDPRAPCDRTHGLGLDGNAGEAGSARRPY